MNSLRHGIWLIRWRFVRFRWDGRRIPTAAPTPPSWSCSWPWWQTHFLAKVSRALSRPYTFHMTRKAGIQSKAWRIVHPREYYVVSSIGANSSVFKEFTAAVVYFIEELNSIWYTIKKNKEKKRERERKCNIKIGNIKLWIFKNFYKKFLFCFFFSNNWYYRFQTPLCAQHA